MRRCTTWRMDRAEALKRDAIAEPDPALCLVTPLGVSSFAQVSRQSQRDIPHFFVHRGRTLDERRVRET